MQFIDLQAQYRHSKERIDKRINNVLNHGKYIMGPEVSELEEQLADYVGVKHALTCANGTDALTLCLMTLGVKAGDAVFCPTFTFFATAEVIAFSGAAPIFVDSDEFTFNICPKSLEEKIKAVINEGKYEPKAIIAVDLFGLPANYPEIEVLAKKYNLKLIEDSAQGFGGSINGKKSCSFGDLATTSFFPAKPLGCYGDGGAVFTDNDEYAELLKSLRIHGKGVDKYDNVRIGMNSRLDTIQAAILIEKLAIFPQEMTRKNEIANLYNDKLSSKFIVPTIPVNYESSWAQYTLRDENRDDVINKLSVSNIPAMVYYAKNMHQQPAFYRSDSNAANCSIAEELCSTVFSLPMHAYLSNEDVSFIAASL